MISISLSQLNRHGCVVSAELPPCIHPSIGYTACFDGLLSIPAVARKSGGGADGAGLAAINPKSTRIVDRSNLNGYYY